MLAHFHYGNKGGLPFRLDWTSPAIATFAKLDSEQEKFMQQTTEWVKQRAERFRILKDSKMFEDDYFFVSQLYETDWKPMHTV
jgi:metal-dependent hydrolase (beta-lactamase superfamily II)